MKTYWPFAPPDSDHENWDQFTDDAACGLLDPDWLVPARLPGRPLRNFTNVTAPPRRDPASPSGRSGAESHGSLDDPRLLRRRAAVAPFTNPEE